MATTEVEKSTRERRGGCEARGERDRSVTTNIIKVSQPAIAPSLNSRLEATLSSKIS